MIFFAAIIGSMIVNTSFLVREIRRNGQHDSFINAVTHELKTPIASIRLYLGTMQRREVDEAQRQEFYRLMLLDTDRLLGTVEQVLAAGTKRPQIFRRIAQTLISKTCTPNTWTWRGRATTSMLQIVARAGASTVQVQKNCAIE